MTETTTRPPPDQWLAKVPTLKKVGSQLEGPCPSCGGTDRFHVQLAEPHLFGCRQCEDGPGILREVFGDSTDDSAAPPVRRPRRSNADFLIAEYRTAAGKLTQVYRKDWPEDWEGMTCDFKDCKATGQHKHVWRGRGQPYRHLLLLLWPPTDPVDADLIVICEGEKAAKAVQLAGFTGASYCGGVPAGPRYADYSPVTGRPVLVWPDADDAGVKAGKEVAEKALLQDASSVHLLAVEDAGGLDAADYSREAIRQKVNAAIEGDALPTPDVGQGIQGAPPKTAIFIQPDKYGLKAILDYLELEIRENPRNLRAEIRRKGPPAAAKLWAKQWAANQHPGGWIPMTDGLEASLRQTSREHFVFRYDDRGNRPATWTDRDLGDAVLNNCPRPAVDPFQSWFEELPPWDGSPRIARLWIDTLAMPDEELTREAGRRFLIGAIRRSLEPGCVHDWIPVLVGDQGLGKSSMLRELVSPALEWFSDGTQLDGDAKTKMETTGPAVISEFSEMAGLDRADSAKFKTYLSQRADQLRSAYGHHAQRTERQWIGVGTANPDPGGVLPSDPTGARRYVVMESEYKGHKDELETWAAQARAWVRTNLEQLWAEALFEYRHAKNRGDDAMNLIPGHLRSKQESAAEGFQRHFEGLREVAHQLIPYGQEYEQGHGYGPTIAELMEQGRLADDVGSAAKDRGTQTQFGRELTAAGWKKRQRKVRGAVSQRWYAPMPEGQALIQPGGVDQGVCMETFSDGSTCGNPTRNKAVTRCDSCVDRLMPPSGPATGGTSASSPPQGALDAGLQGHLQQIAAVQEELKAAPESVAFLEMQARAFRSLRSAAPDGILTPEDLALLGGVDDVLSIIEQLILSHPARASVRWETVNWEQFLTGWLADFKKSLEPSLAGRLDQGKVRFQHVINQRRLLPNEGAPA